MPNGIIVFLHMRMLHNPIRRIDPDGKDWKDKVAGVTIGVITNVVPFSGSLRDQYTPNDRADYNNMLAAVDCSSIAFGGTMIAGGTATATGGMSTGLSLSLPTGGASAVAGGGVAVGGFAVAAEGTIIMINSLMNKSEGYDRGGKKDDGNNKPTRNERIQQKKEAKTSKKRGKLQLSLNILRKIYIQPSKTEKNVKNMKKVNVQIK